MSTTEFIPKADSRRYFMLSMYCLLSLSNSANWVSFAPISGDNAVNWLALIWSVLYGPGSVLGVLWFKKFKLRDTLILGGAFTVGGCLLRLIAVLLRDYLGSEGTYALVFVGQALAGLGQPVIVNLATAIASTWFPMTERDRMTTLAAVFNPLGNAVGQILPPMIVSADDDGDDNTDDGSYKDVRGMNKLMLIQFLMAVVPLVMTISCFAAQPTIPASYAEAYRGMTFQEEVLSGDARKRHSIDGADTRSSTSGRSRVRSGSAASAVSILGQSENALDWSQVRAEFMELMSNGQYVLLLISFSFGLGMVNSVLTLVFQLVEPYGYSNEDAGLFGFVMIICGMVGAAIIAVVLERTRMYRAVFSYGFLLCSCTVVLFTCMLYRHNFDALIASFALMGFTIVPLFPACLENVAECTYPVSEDMSVGILLTLGNIGTVIITLIMSAMINLGSFGHPPLSYCNVVVWIILAAACVVALMYKGDSKRLNADLAHARANDRNRNSSISGVETRSDSTLQEPLLLRDESTGSVRAKLGQI